MQLPRLGNQEPTFTTVRAHETKSGDAICAMFERRGVKFVPFQRAQMQVYAARNEYGRNAYKTVCDSIPRQNGKSFTAREYALACALLGLKVLYSAHNGTTVRKMFRAMCDYLEGQDDLSKQIVKIVSGKGSEGIYLANHGVVEFQTRTVSGARGGTFDVIIVDESQELTYDQLDAIAPTLIASDSGDAQTIYLGTPPNPKCPGEVFADLHKTAHSDNPGALAWSEWAIETVPDISDRQATLELVYKYNPSMGYRIHEDVMLDLIDKYQARPDRFAREILGWWSPVDAGINTAVDYGIWCTCAVKNPPTEGKKAFGVKFSRDGLSVAISACRIGENGLPHIELVSYDDLSMGNVSIDKVVNFIKAHENDACITMIDGKSNVGDVAQRLKDAGMSRRAFAVTTAQEYTVATSMLCNAVRERGITHFDQAALNDAVAKTIRRSIGSGGAYGFGGEMPEVLDSAALALYGARTSRRNPNRRTVIY